MGLTIPNQFVSGFKVIDEMSQKEIRDICEFISKIPAGTGPKQFASLLSSQFDTESIHALASVIYSFGSLLLNIEDTRKEIAENLSLAYNEHTNSESEELKDKLLLLLNHSENLRLTFKVLDLVSDNGTIYRTGRIFSDIRLLFDEKIKENKNDRKGVIIHRLKIESLKNESEKDFYFSMDSNDLMKLKELINRALDKENQIKTDYSNIEFIEISD